MASFFSLKEIEKIVKFTLEFDFLPKFPKFVVENIEKIYWKKKKTI
jgi:hypothetical protein